MNLSCMRFKDFVWPHNPRVYSIDFARNIAVNKVPFGRYTLQNLGVTRRVMRGEGEFVGDDAYDQFKKLASVFYEDSVGVLVHPLWDSTNAWFVALELQQIPRPDYVKYSFEFWEDYAGISTTAQMTSTQSAASSSTSDSVLHTVVKGETMWGIAKKYGVPLSELIALNPEIPNPNLIYIGQKVRVA